MSLSNLNWTIEYYEENVSECNSFLNSLGNYDKIPSINYTSLQNIRDGALVRYRGMIQDMLNPEYYSSSYTVVNKQNNESYERSGKFRDVTFCNANEEFKGSDHSPKERQVLFCIPIPASNDWVENYMKENPGSRCQSEESCSGIKRGVSESDDEMEVDGEKTTNVRSSSNMKKSKLSQEKSMGSSSETYNVSNYFPFHRQDGQSCFIKIYEEEEKFKFILNDRIEVIGFLSLNPALEANWEGVDGEDRAVHPPPSLVPRIHAIFLKKLNHSNPLLKQIIPHDYAFELAEAARSDLHLILTQLLFEDTIAADYFLCHLLSRVHFRNESLIIGKFSLNLFNIKCKDFAFYLNNVLKMLVTNSHCISLSIKMLNDSSFIPKKDYESNRLWSGILQQCNDTHLILDETNMDEGQLKNQGCLNIMALQKLLREQEVQYDFGYYSVSYNSSIPILVLSEGKSMFEADVRLKLKPDSAIASNLEESYRAVCTYLSEEILIKLRKYLTAVRLLDFEMGEEMMKKIGEDYVMMRQRNDKVNSSDLHNLLVLSRLLALSHGRNMLSGEDWTRALEMETERKSRLN